MSSRTMHDRLAQFERILNFRDFGGYDTADGARVARGKLYRSASFHEATAADIARLNGLGLRFLVDLRRPGERAHEPNRWSAGEGAFASSDDNAPAVRALPPHLVALLQCDVTPSSVAKYMDDLYRGIPFDPRLVKLYRDWLVELGKGGAGVIHCSAGKDRTGFGCALTLFALGVPEDAIYEDYEFTNQAVDIEARLPGIQARMEAQLGRKLNAAALRPMLGVHVDYLRAAITEIERRHGSVTSYLEDVLGVSAEQRSALRERLAG